MASCRAREMFKVSHQSLCRGRSWPSFDAEGPVSKVRTAELRKWFHILGTFICWLSSLRMSDRATTQMIGLSLSGILFAMLILNAFAG
jgi:hypothetical protein